jgi:hypothetical protein
MHRHNVDPLTTQRHKSKGTQMSTKQANQSNAASYAAAHKPFKASALIGTNNQWAFPGSSQYGDRDASAQYERALRSDLVSYVVQSYAAPIVWCDVWGDWHPIHVSRSVTTTRHQNKMHRELVRPLSSAAQTFWSLFNDAPTKNRADADALRATADALVRG